MAGVDGPPPIADDEVVPAFRAQPESGTIVWAAQSGCGQSTGATAACCSCMPHHSCFQTLQSVPQEQRSITTPALRGSWSLTSWMVCTMLARHLSANYQNVVAQYFVAVLCCFRARLLGGIWTAFSGGQQAWCRRLRCAAPEGPEAAARICGEGATRGAPVATGGRAGGDSYVMRSFADACMHLAAAGGSD